MTAAPPVANLDGASQPGGKRCLTNIVDLSFSFPSAEMEGWFRVLDVLGAIPKVRTR